MCLVGIQRVQFKLAAWHVSNSVKKKKEVKAKKKTNNNNNDGAGGESKRLTQEPEDAQSCHNDGDYAQLCSESRTKRRAQIAKLYIHCGNNAHEVRRDVEHG